MKNKKVCVWETLKTIAKERLPRYFSYSDREHLFVNLNDIFAFFTECVNKTFKRNDMAQISVSRLDEEQEYTFQEADYVWAEMKCIIEKTLPSYFDYVEKVNKSKGVEVSIKDINGFLQFFEEVINITLSKDFKQKITISKLEENV
jgi:hypothetical protein